LTSISLGDDLVEQLGRQHPHPRLTHSSSMTAREPVAIVFKAF
jgi:hypothetical protein